MRLASRLRQRFRWHEPSAPPVAALRSRRREFPGPLQRPLSPGLPAPGPDPWVVSDRLLARRGFKPAARLNALAAAWIQFHVGHWWDRPRIYGDSQEANHALRTGSAGELIDGDTPDGADHWPGLSIVHTLLVKEHNAICRRLHHSYPRWDDETLFGVARLVNTALMAKIHTVEWTGALLSHPAQRLALRATRIRLPAAVEPISVCWMHPLLADEWEIRSHVHGRIVETVDLPRLRTCDAVETYGPADLLYSFGVARAGAPTLHNHPEPHLGAREILRDREQGVPRFNRFRRMLHKPPARSFADLAADPRAAKDIRDVYAGDIEHVDLVVGSYAEPLRNGFASSDTVLRIIILMDTLRRKRDPFLNELYDPGIYTPEGLGWIKRNGMAQILWRHHPELAPALDGIGNPFASWRGLS